MSQLLERTPAPTPAARFPGSPRPLAAAGAASLAAAAAGIAALLGHLRVFADADSALARAVLGPAGVTWLLVAVALAGLAGAVLGLTRPASASVRTAVAALAAVEVVVVGMGLQSIETIALAGYLFAMALPVAAVWLAVQWIRHYRRLRWGVVAALAAMAASGIAAGPLQPSHLAALAGDLRRGFAAAPGQLLMTVLLAALSASWALLSIALLRTPLPPGASAAGSCPTGAASPSWRRPARCRTG